MTTAQREQSVRRASRMTAVGQKRKFTKARFERDLIANRTSNGFRIAGASHVVLATSVSFDNSSTVSCDLIWRQVTSCYDLA